MVTDPCSRAGDPSLLDLKATVEYHLLRPGVILHWGSLREQSHAPENSTIFIFSLAAGGADPGARMAVRQAPSLLPPEGFHSAAFSVFVSLTEPALQELLAGDESPGATCIRAVATGESALLPDLPLTENARLAVESIRRCPFVGACRTMAFTARGNDLLVEFLTVLANSLNPRSPPLTSSLTAHIHAAAETLKRELESPPTLPALARSTGLSESTLKRGFHQVFGTTVFGYLRARRMERARALLERGDATVLEAATLVGYSNPSNFSAAFRRQFGLNPKAFQLTGRR
jgi:AraC-like DNA-binding protein